MTKKELIKNLNNIDLKLTKEMNQYTGKLSYIIYSGDFKKGIYTIFKGSLNECKKYFINKI